MTTNRLAQVGARVVVPGGRVGTVVGVKEVYIQLDGVGSRNSVAVDLLTAAPDVPCRWCGQDWFDHDHPEKGHVDAIC